MVCQYSICHNTSTKTEHHHYILFLNKLILIDSLQGLKFWTKSLICQILKQPIVWKCLIYSGLAPSTPIYQTSTPTLPQVPHSSHPLPSLLPHRILSRDECFDSSSKTANLKGEANIWNWLRNAISTYAIFEWTFTKPFNHANFKRMPILDGSLKSVEILT